MPGRETPPRPRYAVSMGDSVSVRAPGKINLVLRVGPPGADGYHELVTCFHAVDLWETITVTPAEELTVSVSGSVELGEIPLAGDNLALRGAAALAQLRGYDGGAHVAINKQVPVGGGMGGGSADAAATLVALNKLWGTRCTPGELHDLAAGLGADVPFALMGSSAVGRNRGDVLESVPSETFHWVIVTTPVHLSTPQVYSTLDDLRAGVDVARLPEVSQAFRDALASGDPHALAPLLVNDLAPAALAMHPELAATLDLGEQLGALAGMVSGSGPTLVFLARDVKHQSHLASSLSDAGHRALAATSPAPGAHLVP